MANKAKDKDEPTGNPAVTLEPAGARPQTDESEAPKTNPLRPEPAKPGTVTGGAETILTGVNRGEIVKAEPEPETATPTATEANPASVAASAPESASVEANAPATAGSFPTGTTRTQ